MNKQLILSLTKDDFEIQTFLSGGKGGQNQNKRETGVRIIHKASGAVGEARDNREQKVNKKNAFKRLSESAKFKTWLYNKIHEIENKETIEESINKMMEIENLKIEGLDENGNWIEI